MGKIKEKIIKVIWPWFKETIWPAIKEFIIKKVFEELEKLFEKLKDHYMKSSEEQTQKAATNAENLEKKAKASNSAEEADKLKAMAKIWREVEQQYSKEHHDFKDKIQASFEEAKKGLNIKLSSSDFELRFRDNDQPILEIDGEIYKPSDLPKDDK